MDTPKYIPPSEVKWMQTRTKRILTAQCKGLKICDLIGKESSFTNGRVAVSFNGFDFYLFLGDISYLTDFAIDQRFRSAFMTYANVYMSKPELAQKCNLLNIAVYLLMDREVVKTKNNTIL